MNKHERHSVIAITLPTPIAWLCLPGYPALGWHASQGQKITLRRSL